MPPPKTPPAARKKPDGPMDSPYVILIDTREKTPFLFHGLKTDAKDGSRPLNVKTVIRGMPSGDYSIEGMESQVAVERKSLQDLYNTLGQGRDRFERELERLNAMEYAAVVIEASWQQIITEPPRYSKLPPKIVFRSIVSWQQRFTKIHWWPCEGKRLAEVVTLRILERFWRDRQFRTPKTVPPTAA
jgi:ERCC4-type nuclease